MNPLDGDDPQAGADEPADADHLDEVRQAAGAVVASLKWLIEATERVVEDPGAFSQAVDSGKSVVEAFLGGFAGEENEPDSEPDTQGEDFVDES
ncbi:MAG: hypothetical protein AAF548_12870 [Actinomycetota bacterium]